MARAQPRRRPKPPRRPPWWRRPWFYVLLCLLVTGTALFYTLFIGPGPARRIPVLTPRASKRQVSRRLPSPPTPRPERPATPLATAQPPAKVVGRLAIVIDDMGYHRQPETAILALDHNLSFAFLPHTPFSRELLAAATKRKRDILLHLPMEPTDAQWDPGPGALRTTMDRATMAGILAADLAQVPGAVGVNNHMGSRFTSDRRAMALFMPLLARHRLFFLDSLTTPTSLGREMGRRSGVAVLQRDVFLDNDPQPAAVTRQLDTLVTLARQRGRAIGIGHPKPGTLAALARWQVPADLRLVAIHELVE